MRIAFCGQREIVDEQRFFAALTPVLEELFMRGGERLIFYCLPCRRDRLAAAAVRALRKKYPGTECPLLLVAPGVTVEGAFRGEEGGKDAPASPKKGCLRADVLIFCSELFCAAVPPGGGVTSDGGDGIRARISQNPARRKK